MGTATPSGESMTPPAGKRGPRGSGIMVECDNCGWGHRWIPPQVERELEELRAEVERLRTQNVEYAEFIVATGSSILRKDP